jgi:Domain of unknown function (DUF4189)
MGLMRKAVRKSVRKVTPRPVRQVQRAVTHPVRTSVRAVTPQPIRNLERTAFNVAHPVNAVENKVLNEVIGPPRRRAPKTAGPRRASTPADGTYAGAGSVAPSRTAQVFAAIAYSPSRRRMGYAWSATSRAAAEQLALKKCGIRDAQIVMWGQNVWVALALSSRGWGSGWGRTKADAETTALRACPGGTFSQPRIRLSFFAPEGPSVKR